MFPLAALFPDDDLRFHLTLRRGEPAEFFRDRDLTGAERAERRRWVAQDPERYATLAPAGESLFDELRELAPSWGLAPFADVDGLAGACEPDIVLLSREVDGRFRLRGGALVFPSGWDLREKLGRTVGEIHDIVPGLNDALGVTIDKFLARITPGPAFHRANWGLTAHDELNAHPARGLSAPRLPVDLERLWLRVEHQALLVLPRTGGLVFGIRVVHHRLDTAICEPGVATGLARALATLDPALAAYKRVDGVARELADFLRARSPFTET